MTRKMGEQANRSRHSADTAKSKRKFKQDAHLSKKDDPLSKLKAMDIRGRIVAVADDVDSKRDEYRSIEAYELASLLGIDDAHVPGSGWDFVWYVPRSSIADIFDCVVLDDFLSMLELQVSAKRLKQLKSQFKTLCMKPSAREDDFGFLTKSEQGTIARIYMESCEPLLRAYRRIAAPEDRKLSFEVHVGDWGESDSMMTPYDDRDGAFQDFSDCLITEETGGIAD
jgi:hypothetical protein